MPDEAGMPEVELLGGGKLVALPSDAGIVLAADLFNERAVERLRAEGGQGDSTALPVVLLSNVDHIDAMATDLSADARIVIRRLLPGPLALAAHPTALVPAGARLDGGLVAVGAPRRRELVGIIAALERPLLAIPYTATADERLSTAAAQWQVEAGPAPILDVTRRPARILREGRPSRAELERFILLEAQS